MKKIKILTIILVITLISGIGFFGIYVQKQNRMENKIKEYSYDMDLDAARIIKLGVSDEVDTVIKDAEGKEVEDAEDLTDEEIKEKGYTKEETPHNNEESKTIDNYKKTKNVIEKRLKELSVENYIIKLNEQTGDIVLETPEKEEITEILNLLRTKGQFEMTDEETSEQIINNNHIKSATITSEQKKSGITIYLQLELNQEGNKKLQEFTSNIEENKNQENESETENTTNNTASNTTETEETKEETEIPTKTLQATLDGESINTVSYTEQAKSNRINIPIGEETTNTTTLNQNENEASYIEFMLNTGNIPLEYEFKENQHVLSEINNNQIQLIGYITLAIILIAVCILIIKYKLSGLLGAIAFIGFIASLMITIRYTNVTLSIEGLLAIAMILIANYILLIKIVKEPQNTGNIYKNFFLKNIPIIILAIVFSLAKWTPISSFGMVIFWGIVLMAIYNWIITSKLIKIKEGKEK